MTRAGDRSDPAWGRGHEILTTAEMAAADRRTIAAGTPGIVLMERAGLGIAEAMAARWTPRRTAVLCGPGNNGGDGYVIARRLAQWGWPIDLVALGDPAGLVGDAAIAAARWAAFAGADAIGTDGPAAIAKADLIVDALFGAGLTRTIGGPAADWLMAAQQSGVPVVAVDMPSGVDGDTGTVRGVACPATLTVTFARLKRGHTLMPGAALCGQIDVVDIGLPGPIVADCAGPVRWNHPDLWSYAWPRPGRADHKYSRGHVVVRGGPMLGAGLLAARAARRVGAGVVTLVVPDDVPALAVSPNDPGLLIAPESRWATLLADDRVSALVIGPGNGRTPATRQAVDTAARSGKPLVLDADALTVFEGSPDALSALLSGQDCLTPHAGEFRRLFTARDPGLAEADKVTQTLTAARQCGAVLFNKGPDTVIACGVTNRVIVETTGPPQLATAGSGDVLAGLIGGLRAQGMPPLAAAAAAANLHAQAGRRGPSRLIAEDVIDQITAIVSHF